MCVNRLKNMKYLAFIFYFLLGTILVSCNTKEKNKILQAEEIISEHPDSALLILKEVTQVELQPDSLQALYWLCITNAHANLHQALTEDSMICYSANYFYTNYKQALTTGKVDQKLEERSTKARLLCMLHYWWKNKKEEAEMMSRDIIIETKEEGNITSLIMALRISSQMAMYDYNYKKLLEYSEELIELKGQHPVFHYDEYSRVYNGMAIAAYYIGDYERMESYFQKAISNPNDSIFIWQIAYRNYADLLGETGQTDRAISIHNKLIEKYIASDDLHLSASYLSLSLLYLTKGDFTLAFTYMEKSKLTKKHNAYLERYPSAKAIFLSYEELLNYIKNGKYNIANLAEFNNQIEENLIRQGLILQAKELSKRDLQERNLQLTIIKQKQAIILIALILGITILSSISFFINHRRKLLIIEKEEKIENIQHLLNEVLSSNENTSVNIKKMMLQQLGVIKTLASNPTQANQQMLERLLSIDENSVNSLLDWNSLFQCIDYAYNGFYSHIMQQYGGILNTREIQLCCLLRAGFSTKEINIITKQSIPTIYQRKTQIRAKLSLQEKEDIIEKLK